MNILALLVCSLVVYFPTIDQVKRAMEAQEIHRVSPVSAILAAQVLTAEVKKLKDDIAKGARVYLLMERDPHVIALQKKLDEKQEELARLKGALLRYGLTWPRP